MLILKNNFFLPFQAPEKNCMFELHSPSGKTCPGSWKKDTEKRGFHMCDKGHQCYASKLGDNLFFTLAKGVSWAVRTQRKLEIESGRREMVSPRGSRWMDTRLSRLSSEWGGAQKRGRQERGPRPFQISTSPTLRGLACFAFQEGLARTEHQSESKGF